MIKRGPPVRYPSRYPINYPRRNPLTPSVNHFPDKRPEKKQEKKTLSISTKFLVVLSLLALSALVVFLIVKGISNGNDKDNEDPLEKFNADLKISNAQLLNYSDINVNVNKPDEEDNVESIIFIFYDNNTEVTRKKISILSLEEVNFQVVFHFANASRIDKISIIPVFKSSSGEDVEGEVEDQYVVQENNQSVIDEHEFNDTFICKSNSQCDDLNNCTRDICSKGNCSYTEISNCVSCQENYQCEDLNACTTNKCLNGVCTYLTIPNCVQCYSSQQCDDNKLCTEDICFNDRCTYNPINNCTSVINNTNNTLQCTTTNQAINCNDNNICTGDTCVNNKCVNTPLSNCLSCSSSTECNDYSSCTRDSCSTNKCVFTNITSCRTGDGCCPKGCTYSNDGDCLPVCGNNIKEGTEKCDTNQLGGATCAGVLGTGYTGTLLCINCMFNSSLCKTPCTQTCESLGYNCGTRLICGVKVDCGDCSFGYSCNVNGTCINRCTNSCSQLGLTECASSTYFRTCDNYDDDSCLEWGGLTSCGSGETCEGGECVEENTNPTPYCGDKQCNGVETCSSCSGDCGSCQTYSRTFYVSSSSGDDGNTGLSESSPWRTLDKVNSYTFRAGDGILFKRGDTFRGYLHIEESGSSGNSITFDAYGSGAKPKIWGSKDYSSSSLWVQYSGNIWRTTNAVTTNEDVANLIFNNEASYGFKKTSISSCTSQGDWYIEPSTSRVYLYSSSNPGNYYSHIEIGGAYIGETEEVIKIDSADYIRIRNLDVRYSPNNGIIFMYGSNHGIVEYCDVSWIGGMYVPSAYPYRMGNGIGVWVDANNITIRYNRVNQCYDAGISPQGGGKYTQSNINMYYNVISNVWYCYEVFTYPDSTLSNVNFDNNVCYGMGKQWSAAQRPDKGNARAVINWESGGSVSNCNVRNNIFKDSENTAFRTDSSNIVLKFNNNLYDVSTIGIVGSSTYTTLSQWKSGTSQDSNSLSGNPLFVSSSDFHLQSNSPAINKGVAISGLTKDFEGNPIVGTPDIGAFEYSSSTPSCTSHASSSCYSNTGDVYWYNSCGVREEIRYDCTSTQTCSNGQCVNSGTTNPTSSGPTYYISTSGSDSSTRDGSSGSSWRTLAYACSRVTTSGSTIYVNSGTYIETQQCALAPGVNIQGAGITSVIKSHYANAGGFEGIIKLISGSVTNGNQQISHIKLDGDNLQGYKAISIYQRSNVKIHDITLVDFRIEGIRFGGEGMTTGNSIYNSVITNSCWYYSGDERPCINVENTDGMQIYGNTITVIDRGDGYSATNIESFEGLRNSKIYNNNIINVPQIGSAWAFTIEVWAADGLEIYNNNITGGVDISGHELSNNIKFHHNTVGWDSLRSVYGDGIQIETRGADRNINISYNTFKNIERPIYFCHYDDASAYVENVWIHNNLIYNVGRSNVNSGDGIYFESGPIPPAYEKNINIWNNVIIASSNSPRSGIYLPTADEVSNVNVKNNIISGFSNSPILAAYQASGGSIDGLYIENNLFYNNGNSNTPRYSSITPSNLVYRNNILGQNPLFVSSSNFHLQSSSPGINQGINVGLPYSDGAPDIGAFERQ